MGQEIELKYRATPELLDAIQTAIPGDYTVYQMETTYYDTPDGALSERRWTLRRRRENEKSICTLKTPRPDGFRGEWDAECGDIHTALPILARLAEAPELVRLGERGLISPCGARFVRRALLLKLPECEAELALDRGLLVAGEKTQPLCELEIELKSGRPTELIALAQSLADRFGLIPEPASKFARAKQLAKEG